MNIYRIVIFITVFIPQISLAASFNCSEATRKLDIAICSNEQLSILDEYMADYYFKLKATLDTTSSNNLLTQQREWLKERSKQCGTFNSSCLIRYYQSRIFELRKNYENLVPYKVADTGLLQGIRGSCNFEGENLPENIIIYAGGAYSGRKIEHQIDQSGHQATQFEVIVNSPKQPVALILGAYERSIWNIAWTQGTQIKAVVATGNHRQAVAGLPKDTPILISSHHNRSHCGYLYVSEKNLKQINPFSKRVYGKNVTMVHYASKGNLVFGDQIYPNTKLFTSKDNPPDLFVDKSKPLAGKAGLDDLVAKGLLRRSTHQDLSRWAKRKSETQQDQLPPVASGSSLNTFKPRYVHNGYVILAQITIPAGLYGGNSATFFLDKGIPYPKGNLGHSTLYDFNTMTCRGTGCGR